MQIVSMQVYPLSRISSGESEESVNLGYHVKRHGFPTMFSRTINYILQLITTCTRVQRRIGVSNSSPLSLQGRELRAMLTGKIVLMGGVFPLSKNRICSVRGL